MSAAKKSVLVVEDDLSILSGVSMNLTIEGYEVLQAQDGKTGLERAMERRPDLMILDVMLPEMNGYEVVQQLRAHQVNIPVLMLSAKGTEEDRVMGLKGGADDYLVKPFGLQELLARVQALVRRREREPQQVLFDEVAVDLRAKTVLRRGKPVELTTQELRLLLHLVESPGRTFERDALLRAAWGFGYEGTARTVDNFISQLRQKLETQPEQPRHFLTVRGFGYRFEP